MKKPLSLLLGWMLLLHVYAFSPDFISQYVQNAKMMYADNGYEVVQEKIFDVADLDNGNNTISYALEPGEYFVQLITEPCFKVNVGVTIPTQGEMQGIVSEKPEMRSSIAVFDVPAQEDKSGKFTEIRLNGPTPAFCSYAKARVLIYKHVSG